MDLKLYVFSIYALSLIHLSQQEDFDYYSYSEYDTVANFGATLHEYYMNIKTCVNSPWMQPKDNDKWRNDSLYSWSEYPCKVQLDHRDNCYLYLIKNQTTPTIHGPIMIDPKHIELDIKFDNIDNYLVLRPEHRKVNQSWVEFYWVTFARCHLMQLAYKLNDQSYYPPLNIYLELDSKTASLFPKIEKNDYFMINIINFFDEINPNNVISKSELQRFQGIQFVTASHVISNYTLLTNNNTCN